MGGDKSLGGFGVVGALCLESVPSVSNNAWKLSGECDVFHHHYRGTIVRDKLGARET